MSVIFQSDRREVSMYSWSLDVSLKANLQKSEMKSLDPQTEFINPVLKETTVMHLDSSCQCSLTVLTGLTPNHFKLSLKEI